MKLNDVINEGFAEWWAGLMFVRSLNKNPNKAFSELASKGIKLDDKEKNDLKNAAKKHHHETIESILQKAIARSNEKKVATPPKVERGGKLKFPTPIGTKGKWEK